MLVDAHVRVAQMVEQRSEKPRVAGSIPALSTTSSGQPLTGEVIAPLGATGRGGRSSECSPVVRRLFREQESGGSIPLTPTAAIIEKCPQEM